MLKTIYSNCQMGLEQTVNVKDSFRKPCLKKENA